MTKTRLEPGIIPPECNGGSQRCQYLEIDVFLKRVSYRAISASTVNKSVQMVDIVGILSSEAKAYNEKEGGDKAMFDKTIKDVMTTPVVCVSSKDNIAETARKMRDEDIGAIAVCDDDICVGIITDRDIAVRAIAEGKDPTTTQVSEVMSHQLVHCFEDQSLKEAEKLLEEHQVRRLLVFDRNHKVRGIVALSDIVGVDRGMTGRIVEKVSQPAAGFTGH
jgi:CBS domain-containing protein